MKARSSLTVLLGAGLAIALWSSSIQRVDAVTERLFPLLPGSVNANWKGFDGFNAQQQADGLHIGMSGTGAVLAAVSLPADAQLLTIETTSDRAVTGRFLWQTSWDTSGGVFSSPITIVPGSHAVTAVPLHRLSQWNGTITAIGLQLPPSTSIILHGLTFSHFNPLERLIVGMQSFWTMDSYNPTSINFLWGPQIASNPFERLTVYDQSPPQALSGTLFLSVAGLVAVIMLGIVYALRWRTRWNGRALFLRGSAICLISLWLLLDMRMGSEYLQWVATDFRTFISAPAEERTLRERGHFYDFIEFVLPLVHDRTSYAFASFQQWPYLGNLRYFTYPILPSADFEHDDTWVIFRRPDFDIDAQQRVTLNGQPVTPPGRILGRFDDSSFVFRIDSPAP